MVRLLKKILILVAMLALVFWVYVEVVNRNAKAMTTRQKILKAIYPAFMWLTKAADKNSTVLTNTKAVPAVPFYSLSVKLNNGSVLDFATLKGKKVLLVNTASDCGYTNQYADLQGLYEQHSDKLVIIGFPANDFKEQEKGSDLDIAQFCKVNFGVTFPLAAKGKVVKAEDQQLVFQWLTDPARNGWNSKAPSWNFAKYLVDENGVLTHYFDPSVSPAGDVVLGAVLR